MESPEGKHEPNSNRLSSKSLSLPLSGQTFFLCVRRKQVNEVQLQQRIESLGGILEKFLTKEVIYVLSDEIANRKFSVRCPKPVDEKKSGPQDLPCEKSKRIYSRSNITEKAITWGKKLWRIDKFMIWLKTQEKRQKSGSVSTVCRYSHKNKPSHSKLPVSVGVMKEITHLEQPFIKVENIDYLFRPFYKVFVSEPSISCQTLYPRSPFDGHKEQQSYVRHLKNIESRKSASPLFTGNCQTNNGKHRPIVKAARPQRQYCECCNIYFQNLQQHLEGPKHSQFVNDASNFDCITKVIEAFEECESFEDHEGVDTVFDYTVQSFSALLSSEDSISSNAGNRSEILSKCKHNEATNIPNYDVALLEKKCTLPVLPPLSDELAHVFNFTVGSVDQDIGRPLAVKSEATDFAHHLSMRNETTELLTDDPFLSCFEGDVLKRCSDVNAGPASVANLDFASLHINLSSPEASLFGVTDRMFSEKSSDDNCDETLQCFLNGLVKDSWLNEASVHPLPPTRCNAQNQLPLPIMVRPSESFCQNMNSGCWPVVENRDSCEDQRAFPCENLYMQYDWTIKFRSDTKIVILRTQKAISVR